MDVHIDLEFQYLKNIFFNVIKISKNDFNHLLKINITLWDIEDLIRIKDGRS